ncbi:uncharacterized protein TNCV_4816101 [Trichonephila clavipes]|nr:uncharacterized protein TNCV_4816101 [Trichonephila clavipes]
MLDAQPAPSRAPTYLSLDAVVNNPSEPQRIQTFSYLNKRSNKFVFLSTAIVDIWSPMLNSYVRGRILCLEKINWDDSLPNIFCIEWNNFASTLKTIENISIIRYLLTDKSKRIILTGYCDASIAAYGAVVYLRSYCENYTPPTKLLASKRVTPLKMISILRPELCSCLLISQLINKVVNSLKLNIDKILLFSDSTIAIA